MGWTQKDLDNLLRRRAGEVIQQRVTAAKQQTTSQSGGKRADLENVYFRSSWEANIARLLNLWKQMGVVLEWHFESDEWTFTQKYKRGTLSYKSDFKIRFAKTPQEWVFWEVKGYMRQKDKTKLKRMAELYPEIRIEVIDSTQYYALKRQWAGMIPAWESRSEPQPSAA